MALTAAQIETLLTSPKRLKSPAGEREAHSLKDIIEALEYLDGQTANTRSASPIRMQRINFGGAVLAGADE